MLLEQKGKELKRCLVCGCELPWNYPYSICEVCHNRGLRRAKR